jgi:Tfp pilus assembly protein PilZ
MGLAIKDDGRFVREQLDAGSRLGRADLEVPVELWSRDEGGMHGVARNLSLGGMFVATPQSLPLGAHVLARFSSGEGGEPDEIEARVSWSRRVATGAATPAGIGLEFVGPMVRAAIFVRVLLRAGRPGSG